MTAEVIKFPVQPLPRHVWRRRRLIELHKEIIMHRYKGKLPAGFELEREAERVHEKLLAAIWERRHGPAG